LIFGSLWLLPIVALATALGSAHVLTGLAIYFSKAAVVTFGGAYAVLGYVSQAAVEDFGWLTAREMIDGLGLAETTPGPLILVLQFVGFVAAFRHPVGLSPNIAGLLGALVTIWVTFVPCFLWIFAGAPHVERLRRNRSLSGALAAVTAAVVGVIAQLSLWFASHALFGGTRTHRIGVLSVELPELASVQWVAVAIALVAAVLLLRFHRSMWLTLGSCCALGVVLRSVAS
jgi:chromate transporter